MRATSALKPAAAAAAVMALLMGIALPAGAATTVDAEIEFFAFAPATVTVSQGDSIRWTNRDTSPHTATADDASFDTGQLGFNQASSPVLFDDVGSFPFFCNVHPDMRGTVQVLAVPDPVVPEAPASVLLPAVGIASMTAFSFWRRRRRAFGTC